MSEKHIPVEYEETAPSKVRVTKLGKGLMVAAAVVGIGIPTVKGENPVGEAVQTVLIGGMDVLDAVPGIDLPDRE